MTAPQTPRDVCLGVLDGAEAHDYGNGYGSPGVACIGLAQAAKITDDLLAALAEAGYVVVRAKDAAPVVTDEMVEAAIDRRLVSNPKTRVRIATAVLALFNGSAK